MNFQVSGRVSRLQVLVKIEHTQSKSTIIFSQKRCKFEINVLGVLTTPCLKKDPTAIRNGKKFLEIQLRELWTILKEIGKRRNSTSSGFLNHILTRNSNQKRRKIRKRTAATTTSSEKIAKLYRRDRNSMLQSKFTRILLQGTYSMAGWSTSPSSTRVIVLAAQFWLNI